MLASAALSVRAAAYPREAVPDLRRAAAGEVARAVVVEIEVHRRPALIPGCRSRKPAVRIAKVGALHGVGQGNRLPGVRRREEAVSLHTAMVS